MKTYRQIRQSLTEVGADREEDKNFKLGPEKMSPLPSDEEEYDELDDTEEDEHQVIDAVRPLYVRDKLGHYTTSDSWSSSGTMAQMIQQTATKNLQSEYVPEEDGEALDEEETIDELSKKTLGHYTKRAAKDLGDTEFNRGAAAATGMAKSSQLKRTRKNRRVGIGRAVNRLVHGSSAGIKEEAIEENAMDTLKKVVARNAAETVSLADGSGVKVDPTTANALLGVHGALNIHNQKKMADTLNSNKAGFAKMSKFAFKQFGSRPGQVGTPNLPVQEDNEVLYTKAEREAAAARAKANRAKRAAARRAKNEEVERLDELTPDEADAMRLLIKNRQRIDDEKRAKEAEEKKKNVQDEDQSWDKVLGDTKSPAAKKRWKKLTKGSGKPDIRGQADHPANKRPSNVQDEYIYTQEEWDSLSESEKGDILMRQTVAKRIKRNRELKAQKREVARGKRKSGKTSDKVYDYMIDKEEGKDQKTEKNPPRQYDHSRGRHV